MQDPKPKCCQELPKCTTTMTRLKPIWNEQNITQIQSQRTLTIRILLFACVTWTLTIELQRMIKAVEMRCYRCLLHMPYNDHTKNEIVCNTIQAAIGPNQDISTTVTKNGVTTVRTCDQIKWPLQKDRTRHSRPYQGKQKEEGKRKDGMKT